MVGQNEKRPLVLGECPLGWKGSLVDLTAAAECSLPWEEMERRLIEMGFVAGAKLEILHEGPLNHDPIAVRVDDTTVALRRKDASAVLVATAEG